MTDVRREHITNKHYMNGYVLHIYILSTYIYVYKFPLIINTRYVRTVTLQSVEIFDACLILWNHYSPVPMDAQNLKKQKESNSAL